jgi:hypothetical protein
MDAKYNVIADNLAVRITLMLLGFTAWVGISLLLLAAA